MSRPVKILLIVIAVVLVLAFVVPSFIDVDHYRAQIIAEAESQTGRKIEIGHISARILPVPGFSVQNVTLGPPAGFAPVNLLSVEKVTGSVALLPLLGGKVEVSSIDLVKPHITLATDEHGHTNYDLAPPAGAKRTSGGSAPGETPLSVGSVSVTDAEVSMVEVRDRAAQPPSMKISGFTAEFSNLDLSPKGMSRWKGEIPLSGLKAQLAGMPAITFRSGNVKIDSGDITADCEIELPDSARIKGAVSVLNFPRMLAAPAAGRSEVLGNGKFTSDKIHVAPYDFTNFSMEMKAYSDHIEAPITLSLYGGTLGVTARLETAPAANGARRFTASVQVSRVDLEKLAAADPGTRGKLTGHAEVRLQLAGALGGNLMESITGQGNFTMRDGRVSGLQAAKSFQALSKVGGLFAPGLAGSGDLLEANYSSVEGDLSVRGGRIYTSKTEALTNRGKGEMHGSIGFDESLDLSGTWTLASSSSGSQQQSSNPVKAIGGLFGKVTKHTVGEFPIPFQVKGSLQHPLILPG